MINGEKAWTDIQARTKKEAKSLFLSSLILIDVDQQ